MKNHFSSGCEKFKNIKNSLEEKEKPKKEEKFQKLENKKGEILESKYRIKIIALGTSGVGKTSLIYSFEMGYSMLKQLSTIGITPKYIKFKLSDDSIIACSIMDTSGADRYRPIVETVYKDTDGILIVYDITNRRSFEEIEKYFIPTLKEKCKKKHFVVMLLGNKKDLEDKRKISFEEGSKLASKYNFLFEEVSCCENINFSETFQRIIESTYYEKKKKLE